MLKFNFFEQDGSLRDVGNPLLCSFGITEAIIPTIASVLGTVGIGASTAGSIAPYLASGLVNAGVGAGMGALTNNTGAGAAMGALNGLFGGAGGSGGSGGALAQALGIGGPQGGVTPAGAQPSSGVAGQTFAPSAAPAVAGGRAPAASGALAASSANAASGLGGASGPLAILMGLAQMSSARPPTEVPPPPGFNDPYKPSGYIDRSPTQNYQPSSGDWYRYGASPQPQFFSGNQLNLAGSTPHMAKGGALSRALTQQKMASSGRPVSTATGDHYVRGGGDGTSDSIPARLSKNEYILTSQDVSRIGNGSAEAGAEKLDEMRKMIAKDAGAKQFQPRIKSPLEYLRKAA